MPGEITSALSEGTNALLKLGAAPVTRPQDVLDLYGLDVAVRVPGPELGSEAEAVLARLREAPLTVDELVRASRLDPSAVAAALTELELMRCVALEDGVYRAAV